MPLRPVLLIAFSTSKETNHETHNGITLARRRPVRRSHGPDLAVQVNEGRLRRLLWRRLQSNLLPEWLRRLL